MNLFRYGTTIFLYAFLIATICSFTQLKNCEDEESIAAILSVQELAAKESEATISAIKAIIAAQERTTEAARVSGLDSWAVCAASKAA